VIVLRLLSYLLVVFVVAAVAAAWLVVPRLDPNLFRSDLTAIATARLGRSVRIDGPMHLDLLPEPTLTADNVKLGSDQGLTITAKELLLRVALGPLMGGHVDARELVLRGASMHVPWPIDPEAVMVRTPRWLSSVTARVEDGKLDIGGLAFSGIDATLTTGTDSGSYAAAGTAILSGQPWRFTARLTQPGLDGSAGLDVVLDGQGPAQGIGGTLSGQIGPDGTLGGRITGRGPDLSHLLPAPAVSFKAEGRVTIAGGLAAADDLAMEIGGSPARGAVALRVTPTPRLDVALAASRLDLDAWMPVLMRSAALTLPTGIDLSAEAATFVGGTLRGLRAAVDLSTGGAEVREVRAVLPGDAPLRLSGRIVPAEGGGGHPAQFEGDIAVTAPALRTTLAWVQQAGVAPVAALPDGVLRTAELSGHIVAEPRQVAVASLTGSVDGTPIAGSLSLRGGKRWVLGAGLSLDRLDLDSWLPGDWPALPSLPARFTAFDLNLRLEAKQALFHGITLAPLSLDAGAEAGRLAVRKLDVQVGGVHASASATIGDGGHVSEGRLDIEAPRAAALAALLPDDLAFLGREAPGLWQTATNVQVLGAGAPDKLTLKISADLADLRLESQPVLDLTRHSWSATTTLRHPGAPRLLRALGVAGAGDWLGDGSLGLIAQLSGAPGKLSADSFDLTAGSLRATGALLLDRGGALPLLSGHVVAETLPLPLPDLRTDDPLPVGVLRRFNAAVKLQADHVLAGLMPVLRQAQGTVTLQDGVARVDLTRADLSGGGVAGVATLDARVEPPAAALAFGIVGAAIEGPVFDRPIDLTDGALEAHVGVTATGHAPAALLATLAGDATFAVRNGALAGLSLGKTAPKDAPPLDEAALRAALAGGATPFDLLSLTAHVERGVVALHGATLTGPDGGIAAEGSVDLPGKTLDLSLALRPPVADPPTLRLRLTGPWDAPQRSLDLTELPRWRDTHGPETPAAAAAPPTGAPATQTP
jgi:hypothetical protein